MFFLCEEDQGFSHVRNQDVKEFIMKMEIGSEAPTK
ncbi:hypothetical protein SAMN05444487_11430 [Marininema mesophilum]|uniref:Uncharacterized protein n=1 Tax=Marininema mesophilum TaxID=1048340 RepID=A0A1H3ARL1_9BACL|nr:hypothetical protein SAMN05444487_11430 [Marininema mesophilum]